MYVNEKSRSPSGNHKIRTERIKQTGSHKKRTNISFPVNTITRARGGNNKNDQLILFTKIDAAIVKHERS